MDFISRFHFMVGASLNFFHYLVLSPTFPLLFLFSGEVGEQENETNLEIPKMQSQDYNRQTHSSINFCLFGGSL